MLVVGVGLAGFIPSPALNALSVFLISRIRLGWFGGIGGQMPVVPAKVGTSGHNVLSSCLLRNDGVKALAFNDLFRVSLYP